jgi:hypothetical protein
MRAMMVVTGLEVCKLSLQVNGIPEQHLIKKLPAKGSDQLLNESVRIDSLANNLQLRHRWLIQQIDRLLKPLILYECCICLLGCLDKSMAQQTLNICYGSTSTQ